MKRLAFVALGVVIGVAVAAGFLPTAQGANNFSAYKQLDLFSEAFERVRANYVRPVKDSELIDGAIQGMVSSLDPHSSYMDAKNFADMQIQTKGEFGGIGIEVTMEDGLIKVISPIDGTPGAKAGLKPGDYIAAINGATIQGMALNDAIDKMRGPVGTKVTLTVLRTGEKKPFDVTLDRAVIHVDKVTWRREGDVGYIRVSAFNEETDSGLEKAVRALKKEIGPGLKGYVLDLRNNPGGLLEQAVDVSDDFLNSGEIVSTRGRNPDDTQRYDAKPGDIADGKPVIVLINSGTASAAEIVSGALQDHKRATILGMTSFGKGSVQTIIPLGDSGGALRLTTALYYTPSGRSIQAEGITPDIAVAENDGDIPKIERPSEADLPGHFAPPDPTGKKKLNIIRPPAGKKIDDFQLSYALDILRGKVAMAAAKHASAD
ncbi:MAG: S41 family peptidase [Alphaproteobacteria bacterium]|nr:S41 family peptidase [Alphaproteobacteria bacterium]MDE2109505.1 S41 family peptidase [Alphaproteobacteria bacterium]MDE2495089.1 S41 family peptidase [Alphaproteobacteria bacterium]